MRSKVWVRWLLMGQVALTVAGCADEPTTPSAAPPAAVQAHKSAFVASVERNIIPDQYIVVFKYDQVQNVPALIDSLSTAPGDSVLHVYEHALKGFAARLEPASVEGLKAHPLVETVTPDEYRGADESMNWGLDRIDQHYLPRDRNPYSPLKDGWSSASFSVVSLLAL